MNVDEFNKQYEDIGLTYYDSYMVKLKDHIDDKNDPNYNVKLMMYIFEFVLPEDICGYVPDEYNYGRVGKFDDGIFTMTGNIMQDYDIEKGTVIKISATKYYELRKNKYEFTFIYMPSSERHKVEGNDSPFPNYIPWLDVDLKEIKFVI